MDEDQQHNTQGEHHGWNPELNVGQDAPQNFRHENPQN
jgi:hypothetical protein